jgi:hypothetical protein
MDLFGSAKKTKKVTKTAKTSDAKKSAKSAKTSDTKKSTKSTKSSDAKKTKKSKAKGGNFLGAIGDLVAPTGWGPFATAAGLLALDRADAALRRGTKEKKEKMKGGKCDKNPEEIPQVTIGPIGHKGIPTGNILSYWPFLSGNNSAMKSYTNIKKQYIDWPDETHNIVIKCNDQGKYYYEVNILCDDQAKTYIHTPENNKSNRSHKLQYYYETFDEAKKNAQLPDTQISLIKLALLHLCKKATKS